MRPKNPYLKISVRWCSGVICPEFCKGIQGLQRGCSNTRPRHDHRRRATKGEQQRNFLLIYRYNCTNSKIFEKKLRKIWKFNFLPYLCSVIKQQISLTINYKAI